MTETLQDRLRHGADNIHSIGPDRAADLLSEAAACFDHDAKVEANMAKRVAHAQHDAAMWKRRCKRYEAWWALPQDQRHPGGPEFGGADGFAAQDASGPQHPPHPDAVAEHCAGLTDDAQHAASIVRLMTLARLYPDEMGEAVGRLVDLVLADKLPAIREAMAR